MNNHKNAELQARLTAIRDFLCNRRESATSYGRDGSAWVTWYRDEYQKAISRSHAENLEREQQIIKERRAVYEPLY